MLQQTKNASRKLREFLRVAQLVSILDIFEARAVETGLAVYGRLRYRCKESTVYRAGE